MTLDSELQPNIKIVTVFSNKYRVSESSLCIPSWMNDDRSMNISTGVEKLVNGIWVRHASLFKEKIGIPSQKEPIVMYYFDPQGTFESKAFNQQIYNLATTHFLTEEGFKKTK